MGLGWEAKSVEEVNVLPICATKGVGSLFSYARRTLWNPSTLLVAALVHRARGLLNMKWVASRVVLTTLRPPVECVNGVDPKQESKPTVPRRSGGPLLRSVSYSSRRDAQASLESPTFSWLLVAGDR